MAGVMRAVVINAFGHYTQAQVTELPKPRPSAGEVLVQAQFSDQSFGFLLHGREIRNKYANASCAGVGRSGSSGGVWSNW